MGWSIGYDSNWDRDIGYGVPAWCDEPGCHKEIDRGLGFVCGEEPYGGEKGCGLYFCEDHRYWALHGPDAAAPAMCQRCCDEEPPFDPSPDHPRWVRHKLTDSSWAQWRAENPTEVIALQVHEDTR